MQWLADSQTFLHIIYIFQWHHVFPDSIKDTVLKNKTETSELFFLEKKVCKLIFKPNNDPNTRSIV